MSSEYNGWANYQTWAAHMWMTNEQESDMVYRAMARTCCADADTQSAATNRMADLLRENLRKSTPNLRGLYADLLQNALNTIDYHGLANAFVSEEWAEFRH